LDLTFARRTGGEADSECQIHSTRGGAVRVRLTGTVALTLLLAASAAGQAQAPPPIPPAAPQVAPVPLPPGFVPPYEIVRTLRAAGFDPLAPPLREGTIYVARATDYRGILMRVVLDARTGAIRDANRIVPGPGNFGGPNGPPPYGGPYGPPSPYGRVVPPPDAMPPPPFVQHQQAGVAPAAPPPFVQHQQADVAPALSNAPAATPPLPRPRPPQLVSRKPDDAAKPAVAPDAKPAITPAAKPDATATTSAVPVAPAATPAPSATAPAVSPAPSTAPAPAPPKPAKVPPPLTINN
jgi:hypothetical protein